MSIWDIHFLSGKVSRLPVRPKMFLWCGTDFTSCRQDIPPRPQRPHDNIKRIITRKMVIIFIERLLRTALRASRATTHSSLNSVTRRCCFHLTHAEAFVESLSDLPKVNN